MSLFYYLKYLEYTKNSKRRKMHSHVCKKFFFSVDPRFNEL